ncbi:Eco57I restriction-modification methylase domain-containing protein [Thermospira aquatica]|uniref:site-specific DNA-methyltransferase (adenine-specific) n=1 Tax=Thermospira aquatica TaxID=2828656 RepID=A0AAX3BFJ4_9SPIR|nr:TaqI-like C-terminal specificity domain-containing protein [Thermospira aquatica]URA10893.1 Eco57I restriction-modification methylase domain-containing protein [Thermospira aquatica]
MNTEQAKKLLKKTFENSFDRNNFPEFVSELLHTFQKIPSYPGELPIPETYKDYIHRYERVGEYHTKTHQIDILIVYLNRPTSLERARTMQRNFVAGYLQGKHGGNKNRDAALVAFVSPESDTWRFSLVKVEYHLKTSQNKGIKVEEKFTSAKRWSFLLGKNEKSHTAQKQFLPLLENESSPPTLQDLEKAFNIEVVTKEFYKEIANWYFWALKESRFPADAESETNGRNIALIRFITRIIFIWFMKQKGIIRKELFDRESLQQILVNLSDNEGTYYKAILQNLFFATLNTPIEQRRFRREERVNGYLNKDYMNHNYYRYHTLFKDPNQMQELFNDIPFLNGGLFECLDKRKDDESNDAGREIRIDGFSDDPQKQPYLPNFLFFSDEKEIDLNDDYDTKNQKYTVRGLINILNGYNFTVDENTPVDIDVALDPELLGRVFENLLASYNPETATTARKATGSYYTPREIVDYMVKESLKAYFKQKLPSLDEEKLERLFAYEDEANPFDEETTNRIIQAIHSLKILDPAVGSGAFPMGVLHTLVHLLHKLDPHNQKWKEMQIKEIQHILDPHIKQNALNKIEESFALNELDYGRKLYLIQNCIYGVDIQPIAIQIAKLRFFISLLVDEKIDKTQPNYGIETLPNLETKFVTANALIDLEIPTIDLFSENNPIILLQDKLKAIRHEYFIAKTRKEKLQLQQQDKEIRNKIAVQITDTLKKRNEEKVKEYENKLAEEKKTLIQIESGPQQKRTVESTNIFGEIETTIIDIKEQRIKTQKNIISNIKRKINSLKSIDAKDVIQKVAQQISSFDPYDPNSFADWFDPEWMFGIRDCFDIVIGNPPYIQLQKNHGQLADLYKDKGFETFDRMGDIYTLFYERGINLLKNSGILCFITSNKWMRAGYGKKLREFFLQHNPLLLIDLGPDVFESATVDTNILLIQKSSNKHQLKAVTYTKKDTPISKVVNEKAVTLEKLTKNAWFIGSNAEQRLKEKIEKIGKPLKDWDVKIYYGIRTGLNEAFIITTEKRNEILANCKDASERKRTEAVIKPLLRGRDIKRYYYEWAGLWVIVIPAGWTDENRGKIPPEKFILEQFPSLMKHLKPFEEKAQTRDDQGDYWWELRHCAYYPEFEKEKVVYSEIVRKPQFHFDTENFYVEATSFLMTGKNVKYICGLLNSKPITYFFKKWYAGGGLGEEGYRYKKAFLENLPLPPITPANQSIVKQIEELVDKILVTKKSNSQADTTTWEREIDRLVYKLYDRSSSRTSFCVHSEGDRQAGVQAL